MMYLEERGSRAVYKAFRAPSGLCPLRFTALVFTVAITLIA